MATKTTKTTKTYDYTAVVTVGNRFTKPVVNGVLYPVVSSGLRVAVPDFRPGKDRNEAIADAAKTLNAPNDVFAIQSTSGAPRENTQTHTVWVNDSNPNALHPATCDSKLGKALFAIPKLFSVLWDELPADRTPTVRLVLVVDQVDRLKEAVENLVGAYTCLHKGVKKTIKVEKALAIGEGRGVIDRVGTTTVLDLGGSTAIVTSVVNGKAFGEPDIYPKLGFNGFAPLVGNAILKATGTRPQAVELMSRIHAARPEDAAYLAAAAKTYARDLFDFTGLTEVRHEHYTLIGGLACSGVVVKALTDLVTPCGGAVEVISGDPQTADTVGVWNAYVESRNNSGESLPAYRGTLAEVRKAEAKAAKRKATATHPEQAAQ